MLFLDGAARIHFKSACGTRDGVVDIFGKEIATFIATVFIIMCKI